MKVVCINSIPYDMVPYANFIGEIFKVEKCSTYYQQRTNDGEIVRRYELRLEGEALRSFIHEEDSEIIK